MINLSAIQTLATNKLGRTGLILAKKSPEICIGLAIASGVGCVVLACTATLKAEKTIKGTEKVIKKIDEAHEAKITDAKEEYTEEDYKKDMTLVYVKTGVDILKLYLPAIALGALSIGLTLKGHSILSRRNAAIAAAYKLLDISYQNYRERVKMEYGEAAEEKLRYGLKEITTTEIDSKGNEITVVDRYPCMMDLSPYSAIFSEETSTQFERSYSYNHAFLRAQQNYANDLLKRQGHVFLNEVYDMLGLPRTNLGIAVGWLNGYNKRNPNNDQYITFGVDNPLNEEKADAREAMMQPFFLDFNVDGSIFNLI